MFLRIDSHSLTGFSLSAQYAFSDLVCVMPDRRFRLSGKLMGRKSAQCPTMCLPSSLLSRTSLSGFRDIISPILDESIFFSKSIFGAQEYPSIYVSHKSSFSPGGIKTSCLSFAFSKKPSSIPKVSPMR